MSVGAQRLVVNCGSAGPALAKWEDALCATAAHSTVTLADTSAGTVLPHGWLRSLVGRRLIDGATVVESQQAVSDGAVRIDAIHDGYESEFGIRHERRILMSADGLQVAGHDRLLPLRGRRAHPKNVAFAVRFHIHPDVRMSPSQGGDLLLKLPNGEGWRFRAVGGQISLEESVYLGDGTIRRTEQLVVGGTVKDAPVVVAWAFEELDASSFQTEEAPEGADAPLTIR